MDDLMPFDLPVEKSSIIKIIGVGGGGSNAVSHMFKKGIEGVNFIIANTDAQALANSPVPIKIQLGSSLTQGLGAGNKPERGRDSAVENLEEVIETLGSSTRMVFITAGMGGGTGTGAAPVIAEAARKEGLLTVGIVTMPFRFEGNRRIRQATEGIRELSQHVDSLLIIQNEKLRQIYGDLSISNAFERADDVLTVAAKGIAEIITVHGHVNVDFADVETVMSSSGIAVMGSGEGSGDRRAMDAIENALNSPLLNSNDIYGAKNILVNIVSGEKEASMDEIGSINDFIQEASGHSADLIWGNTVEESLGEKIAVTIIATGFKTTILPEIFPDAEEDKEVNHLKESKRVEKNVVEWGDFSEDDSKSGVEESNDTFENSKDDAFKDAFSDDNNTAKELETVNKQSGAEVFTLDAVFEQSEKDFFEKKKQKEIRKEQVTQRDTYSDENEEFNRKKMNRKDSDTIDTMENIPAYKRKKVKIEVEKHSENKDVSKYSLSDEDEGSKIRKSNSYLHNRVD